MLTSAYTPFWLSLVVLHGLYKYSHCFTYLLALCIGFIYEQLWVWFIAAGGWCLGVELHM